MKRILILMGALVLLNLMISLPILAEGEQSVEDIEARVEELSKWVNSEYDEMEDITWYSHKNEDKEKGLGIYIGESEEKIWMRFFAGTRGTNWVFLDKLILYAEYEEEEKENFRLEINLDYDEVESFVSTLYPSTVYCNERMDIPVGDKITLLDLMRITEAKKLKVRFSGESYRDWDMKYGIIQRLKDMLDYYNLVLNQPLPPIEEENKMLLG